MISSLIAPYLMQIVGGILVLCAAVIAHLKFKLNRKERDRLKQENDANAKIWADSARLDAELQKINEASKTAVKASKTATFSNGIDVE